LLWIWYPIVQDAAIQILMTKAVGYCAKSDLHKLCASLA